ncbi:hypothetical protein ACLMNJ_02855 [Streptomyces seoulensis]
MTVLTVSMPRGVVALTGLPQARELLAVSGFLLVDAETADGREAVARLGLEAESPRWFGGFGEPACRRGGPHPGGGPGGRDVRQAPSGAGLPAGAAATARRAAAPHAPAADVPDRLLRHEPQFGVLFLALYVLHHTRVWRRLRGDDDLEG